MTKTLGEIGVSSVRAMGWVESLQRAPSNQYERN